MNLAPIILFTYNRPWHTKEVLCALAQNRLSKDSELYIFCDGAKDNANDEDIAKIESLRAFLKRFKVESRDFKHIHLDIKDKNIGLADSIINGIGEVIKIHKKAIILEDDIVVSKVFLDYMNEGLNRYEGEKRVWSINAWSHPIDCDDLGDCYFWRIPHCWGWGTWEDRWKMYKRDIAWVEENFTKSDIRAIDLDNCAKYYGDFLLNKKGKIKTWAIFNYLVCYKQGALNLAPNISYIRQIGFDGSGVHCGNDDVYNAETINEKFPITFPSAIEENNIALERIKDFHKKLKKPIIVRIKNKLMKLARGGVETESSHHLLYTSHTCQTSTYRTRLTPPAWHQIEIDWAYRTRSTPHASPCNLALQKVA